MAPRTLAFLRDPARVLPDLPPEDRGHLLDAIERLILSTEHGRQALVDSLWARNPAWVMHWAYQPSALSLDVTNVDTQNMMRYTSVVATVPNTGVGLLTLGQISIPLPAGVTTLANVGFVLPQAATRNLTSTVAGPMSLVLMGEQMPIQGGIT